MKRSYLAVMLILIVLGSCSREDSFSSRRLEFEGEVVMDRGAVLVAGKTNLPDGFVLFVQVEQAPGYHVEATWAGQARVTGNLFSFDTTFTQALPYRAKIILSPALNPDYRQPLTGSKLPFAVEPEWEVFVLAGGELELARTIEASFGDRDDHRALLSPAVFSLAGEAESLGREVETLDGMVKHSSGGLARFGRLFETKRQKWKRDSFSACAYYPYTCLDLEKLKDRIGEYYRYAIAVGEKDDKERNRHEKAKVQVEAERRKTTDRIDRLRSALPPAKE